MRHDRNFYGVVAKIRAIQFGLLLDICRSIFQLFQRFYVGNRHWVRGLYFGLGVKLERKFLLAMKLRPSLQSKIIH